MLFQRLHMVFKTPNRLLLVLQILKFLAVHLLSQYQGITSRLKLAKDVVVVSYSFNPLEDATEGFQSMNRVLICVAWVLQDFFHFTHLLFCKFAAVERSQDARQCRVTKNLRADGGLPVALFKGAIMLFLRKGFNVQKEANTFHDSLDHLRWVVHAPNFCNVVLAYIVDGVDGLIQARDNLIEGSLAVLHYSKGVI
jgi:hypothetical protein